MTVCTTNWPESLQAIPSLSGPAACVLQVRWGTRVSKRIGTRALVQAVNDTSLHTSLALVTACEPRRRVGASELAASLHIYIIYYTYLHI